MWNEAHHCLYLHGYLGSHGVRVKQQKWGSRERTPYPRIWEMIAFDSLVGPDEESEEKFCEETEGGMGRRW